MLKKSIVSILFIYAFALNVNVNNQKSYIEYTGYHPLHSWVGVSSKIESTISCQDTTFSSCDVSIDVQSDSFDSQNINRDSNVIDVIEAYTFPTINFKSTSYSITKQKKDTLFIDLVGDLFFHGIKKSVISQLILVKTQNNIYGEAFFQIVPTDFGIILPTLLFISIYDQIDIKANLKGDFK